MYQEKFRSPVLWISIGALVLFIAKTYGLLEPIGLTEESFKELGTLLFAVIVGFGIVNDPNVKGRL